MTLAILLIVVYFSPLLAQFTYDHGAIIRGDRSKKEIALVFTGDSFVD